jgi:hypothetical protein
MSAGQSPALWDAVRAAGLKTYAIDDRHWCSTGGRLEPPGVTLEREETF